jgi:hypothetical protein
MTAVHRINPCQGQKRYSSQKGKMEDRSCEVSLIVGFRAGLRTRFGTADRRRPPHAEKGRAPLAGEPRFCLAKRTADEASLSVPERGLRCGRDTEGE